MTTLTPVRTARHEAIAQISIAVGALNGQPGLSKEDQLARIDTARDALTVALNTLATITDVIESRDLDAHKAAKAEAAAVEEDDDGDMTMDMDYENE